MKKILKFNKLNFLASFIIVLLILLNFSFAQKAHADTDADAYFARMVTAGATLSSTTTNAITNFVTSAKANGYWNILADVSPFIGTNIAQVSVKLKVASGTPTSLVNNGFIDSDILPSGGVKGNGSSYFDTGVVGSTFVASTSGMGGLSVWMSNDQQASTTIEMPIGTGLGSSFQTVLEFNNNGCILGYRWGDEGPACINGMINYIPHGFYHTERQTLSLLKLAVNGIVAARKTTTSTSTNTNTAKITIFAGGTNFRTRATLSFAAVDNGAMTDAQMLSYGKDVAQLQIALGNVVPATGNLNYTIVTGQSLAALFYSTTAGTSTTVATYSALTKGNGIGSQNPNDNPSSVTGDILGLLRPIVYSGYDSPTVGFTSFIGNKWRVSNPGSDLQDMAIAGYGVGSTAYTGLAKGTLPYSNSIDAIAGAKVVSPIYRTGAFKVPGIINIHGESDMNDAVGVYRDDLIQWQSDYETDIKAITGQSGTIPFFVSQPSAWTSPFNTNSATGNAPYDMLQAYELNPTKIIIVGPKYFLPYNASDGIHLTTPGFRTLSQYYAKAWYKTIVQGQTWSPLRPISYTLNGNYIDVAFTGNVGDLAFDTTLVTNPGNYGFEYFDNSSSASITSVATTSSTTVRVTLSTAPSGTNKRIRYAYTGIAGNNGGPTTGPRGNLRDSDTTLSLYDDNNDTQLNDPLYDWAIHFDKVLASDVTPPVVSSINVNSIYTAPNISFLTNENATSTLFYGTSVSYTASSTISTASTTHSYNLPTLSPCTLYHYMVRTRDLYGNISTTTDSAFVSSPCATSPAVSALTVSNVSANSVTLNGAIVSDGNASSTVEGFNWGTDSSYGQQASASGTFGTGSFSQTLSSLTCATTYHFQSFATNSAGTGTSTDQTFTTGSCPSSGGGGSSSGSVGYYTPTTTVVPTVPGCPTGLICTPIQTTTVQTTLSIPTVTLKLGASNTSVTKLQNILISLGYLAKGKNTGYFGPLTQSALINYQKDKGITPASGLYGPLTQASLTNVTIPTTTPVATTIATSTTVILFTRPLTIGSIGSDVKNLQVFLNNHNFVISSSGAGSLGHETNYYGPATAAAVFHLQNSYASVILTPYGLKNGTGDFGTSTMDFVNKILLAQ